MSSKSTVEARIQAHDKRWDAIQSQFGHRDDKVKLAQFGLSLQEDKERAAHDKALRTRSTKHVVVVERKNGKHSELFYLSNDTLPHNPNKRQLTPGANMKIFRGAKDAERAAQLQGEGKPLAAADCDLDFDKISQRPDDRSIGGRGFGR